MGLAYVADTLNLVYLNCTNGLDDDTWDGLYETNICTFLAISSLNLMHIVLESNSLLSAPNVSTNSSTEVRVKTVLMQAATIIQFFLFLALCTCFVIYFHLTQANYACIYVMHPKCFISLSRHIYLTGRVWIRCTVDLISFPSNGWYQFCYLLFM